MLENYNKKYIDGMTRVYGFSQQHQYHGKRCSKNCKNLIHYETHHASDCDFYKGSMSEKYDKMKMQLESLAGSLEFKDAIKTQEQADTFYDFIKSIL